MNPDQPSREQIEARLTALLLGELPAEEAALLRYTIAQDPALQKLHDQLQSALPLVREAAKHPADAPAEKPAPLKLSADRREKLLVHFKTPRPEAPKEPLFWLKRIEMPRLIPTLVVVAIIALLAAMLLPALAPAKRKAQHLSAEYKAKEEALEAQMALEDKRDAMQNAPAPPQPNGPALVATAAPTSSPADVTLGPEPPIAPPPAVPPVQIVLPASQPESGQLADNSSPIVRAEGDSTQGMITTLLSPEEIASKITAPKTSSVYSQNISGYVNHPLADQGGQTVTVIPAPNTTPPVLSPAAPVETTAGQLAVNNTVVEQPRTLRQGYAKLDKQWIVPSQAADSNGAGKSPATTGFGGGSGFGEGSHAYGGSIAGNRGGTLADADKDRLLDATNSATLAWDDSGVNRSLSEGQVSAERRVYRKRAPGETENKSLSADGSVQPAFENSTLASAPPPAQSPAPATPSAPVVANTFSANLAPGTVTPQHGLDVNGLTAGSISDASKTSPATGEPSWIGTLDNSDAPHGPENHFVTRYAYTGKTPIALDQVESTNSMVVNSGGNYTFNPGVSAIAPQVTYDLTPQDKLGVPASDSEKLSVNEALNRYSKLTGRTILRSALPSGGEISIPKSLSKEDETTALQAVLALNGVSVVNVGGNFVKAIPSDQAGAAGSEINQNPNIATAPTPTIASASVVQQRDDGDVKKNESYEVAKADLEQKRKMNELVYSKLTAERLDSTLPNSSMVQITDPAQPGQSQSMWQRLTGQVESTARIRVESDAPDIPGMAASPMVASDPYFIQTTFETMQSEPVLGKVVDALNLQSAWAKNNGGEKLTRNQAIELLKQRLDLQPVKNTKLIAISAKSSDPQESADLANAVAKAYTVFRVEARRAITTNGVAFLEDQYAQQDEDIRRAQANVERLGKELAINQTTPQSALAQTDLPLRKPAPDTPLPQPEILTSSNAFSTFSLNVSDVSFKLAEASLENGKLPDTASIRSEEFINAFNYRDPEAAPGQPMAFTSERASYPFAQNRDLLRFSIKTAAAGRQEGRPLNLVLLLDTSGSMERADRVQIIHEALRVLATQLHSNDIVSVVSFARTARLWADGVSGGKAGDTLDKVGSITPEGGTNLEEAMRLAYETAHRHYLANGMNRVVLLTDGAANLGNVDPNTLKQKVDAQRKQGIALDCFGIGWEDLNDDLLEELSSNGDGRYAFLNSPEDAAKDFGTKLAGALQVAAQDVKVQVEFNPQRVISYRQIGYAKHQLTKQQFRDNTVAAGEIAAQEAGNALYTVETNPNGDGPIATVHVRYRIPGTQDYHEHSWDVAYTGNAPTLDQSSPAMRLAATASAFSEWLAASPYAQEVTPDALAKYLTGVPEVYGADDRPKQLETMIREARSLEGK